MEKKASISSAHHSLGSTSGGGEPLAPKQVSTEHSQHSDVDADKLVVEKQSRNHRERM